MRVPLRFASVLWVVVVCQTLSLLQASPAAWGALAARNDPNPGLESMLTYAIQDEYSARAEYRAILGAFGEVKPFSNIIRSEQSHIAWLEEAYAARSLSIPKDDADRYTHVPPTLKGAFEIGVQAEIDNIAMYDRFLATAAVNRPENAALKALFVRLRDASKNHLEAFRRGLRQ